MNQAFPHVYPVDPSPEALGLSTLCQVAAPSALCLQGKEERGRYMSIHRRV